VRNEKKYFIKKRKHKRWSGRKKVRDIIIKPSIKYYSYSPLAY